MTLARCRCPVGRTPDASPAMIACLQLAAVTGTIVSARGGYWVSGDTTEQQRAELASGVRTTAGPVPHVGTRTVYTCEGRGWLARGAGPAHRAPRTLTDDGRSALARATPGPLRETTREATPGPDPDPAPDLVSTSGRESIGVADRVGLLRAALLQSPLTGVPAGSVTQEIHDLKLTVGWVRGTVEMYESARAHGETDERLSAGARLVLSPVECLVLAWRRGGHPEFQRVRRAQQERGVHPWGFAISGSPPAANGADPA